MPLEKKEIEKITEVIADDIQNRSVLDGAWRAIDQIGRQNIKAHWANMIDEIVNPPDEDDEMPDALE